MDLLNFRENYTLIALKQSDLAADPIEQFERWFQEARDAAILEPNAMSLATASSEGRPSSRTVLMKVFDGRGFVFFTNYHSDKAQELEANPQASLLFPWLKLQRQVHIDGSTERTSKEENEAYFATRPRESQISAWISKQSQPIASRAELERAWKELELRFPENSTIPLPPHWGGYRICPAKIEFWQGRSGRLHDRFRYTKVANGGWTIERLCP